MSFHKAEYVPVDEDFLDPDALVLGLGLGLGFALGLGGDGGFFLEENRRER